MRNYKKEYENYHKRPEQKLRRAARNAARRSVDAPKGKGTVVIFPSYMMHRVSEVTKGTRESLVLWVGGDHYR